MVKPQSRRRVQLFRGEKDGAKFDAPFPLGPVPHYLYVPTDESDRQIAELGDKVPPGMRAGLEVLCYQYVHQQKKTENDVAYVEFQYWRCARRDRVAAAPVEADTSDGNQ